MELTLDEIKAISHYFNRQAYLPTEVALVASKMREIVHPTNVAEEVIAPKKVTKKK